jgi:hypothetical protein
MALMNKTKYYLKFKAELLRKFVAGETDHALSHEERTWDAMVKMTIKWKLDEQEVDDWIAQQPREVIKKNRRQSKVDVDENQDGENGEGEEDEEYAENDDEGMSHNRHYEETPEDQTDKPTGLTEPGELNLIQNAEVRMENEPGPARPDRDSIDLAEAVKEGRQTNQQTSKPLRIGPQGLTL